MAWQECTGWPITFHPGVDWRYNGVDYHCTEARVTVASEEELKTLILQGVLVQIRTPINVTIDNFTQCCVRTESNKFEEIENRLVAYSTMKLLHRLTDDMVKLSESFDILKRYIYYGKLPPGQKVIEPCSNPQFNQSVHSTAVRSVTHGPDHRAARLLHGALGFITESGEFLLRLRRHMFFGDQLDEKNLKEELGDLGWYFGVVCDVLKASPMVILTAVIRKLEVRYPEKFDELRAIFRDIEKEKAALDVPEPHR